MFGCLRYRSELQNTTKALVKAVDHHQTTEIGDLQFRKGDVIRVLDEQPLEPALLGEVNGVVGQVSKSKIKTYHVIQETTDEYLNESVIATERAMALQADSDHSVVMSDQDVASMDSQSSVISWVNFFCPFSKSRTELLPRFSTKIGISNTTRRR